MQVARVAVAAVAGAVGLELGRLGQRGAGQVGQGQIVEENTPHEFFNAPKSERTKDFLSKILGH